MNELTPRQAHDYLREHPEALLIDVRSEIEHLFVGRPPGAIHVAWSEPPEWEINPNFAEEVRRLAEDDLHRPTLVICRSGNRSQPACQTLEQAGFTRVFNVVHGFEGDLDANQHRNTLNGWRHDGLPWQQC
ncbi:rhodanese-like domain-containing protein [Pseudothauera nasutitermitis]|uniref:Rhodanese-like domain-containing protein n=1 Tax=Pseudothauera nasutitermitis TaxID=2565930 RepID=A0A4S4AMP0_9RHOO|nr:rhodanese-like domain-containing protein [Pseudothauera nasutitermitis]THF60787.1 rhodanese-like domain-containing protein [Pseudothauera nasutitermitis]